MRVKLISLGALVIVLYAPPMMAQTPTVINFDDLSASSFFQSVQPPLTVGAATFSGGQLLNAATFLPADPTTVYGTAFFCAGCLPTITIDFSQPVSDLSMLVLNGQTFTVTYTVQDNVGDMSTITLVANFLSGAGTVTLPSTNIMKVTITSNAAAWDFLIDNVQFQVTSQPAIAIDLVPPPPDDEYVIDATPTRPLIQAHAKVINVTPDPTPTTTFTWKVDLTVEKGTGEQVSYADDFLQNLLTADSGRFTLTLRDPSAFRGGNLMLTATATVNGKTLKGQTPLDLRIDGTNPQRIDIQAESDQQTAANFPTGLSGLQLTDIQDTLKRIACQENRQKQFEADANGGVGPPKISPDNGVGIFQITNTTRCPDPFTKCPNTLFSWISNIEEGIAAFQEKVGAAKRYPAQLKASASYRRFITMTVNVMRKDKGLKPIVGFPAPQFTTIGPIRALSPLNQLLRDAVRGYNGFLGDNFFAFGLPLHEFVIDDAFLESVPDEQIPGLNSTVIWDLPRDHVPEVSITCPVSRLHAQVSSNS